MPERYKLRKNLLVWQRFSVYGRKLNKQIRLHVRVLPEKPKTIGNTLMWNDYRASPCTHVGTTDILAHTHDEVFSLIKCFDIFTQIRANSAHRRSVGSHWVFQRSIHLCDATHFIGQFNTLGHRSNGRSETGKSH